MDIESYSPVLHIERPSLAKFTAVFGFAWLMVGLFTGTLVLVVAIRWIVNLLNHWGLGQSAENRVLIGVILLFVVTSFLMTRALVRHLLRMGSVRARRIALGALVIPGALSLWAWSNPTRVLANLAGTTFSTVNLIGGPRFIFGSYPDGPRLEDLKRQGVKTVVSLQHPAVLVELQGIEAEREGTQRLGMRFVQIPMLPWISDNQAALEQLRQLAIHGSGTYYVHCGLGRDRVNIAKRVIESVNAQTAARVAPSGTMQSAMGFEDRIDAPFVRGRVFRLSGDQWLIPIPDPVELYQKILEGRPGKLILLLDPNDPAQAHWLETAEPQLRQYVVPFELVPFPATSTPAAAQQIVAKVRAEEAPFTIVVPATTFDNPVRSVKSPAAAAVLQAYGLCKPASNAPRKVSARTR